MYISEYLQKNIRSLSPKNQVEEALLLVSREQLTHVAVVEKSHLLGMLTEECLWTMESTDTLEKAETHYQKFYLHEHNQLLDTFSIFEAHDTNVIPVLAADHKYLGLLLMEDMVYGLSKFPFIEEAGAILEVQIPYNQYSMAEIGRIVESHNAKLFGAIITEMNPETITLTLKITSESLSSIAETFERFGYIVKEKYYEDKKDKMLEERYQQFQKYLNL